METRLLRLTSDGLYCPVGGFHIDPWRGVPRAVVTHAHSDHARFGSEHYLIAKAGERVFRERLGSVNISAVEYGETVTHNGVRVSLQPAGHVLGSAQVRLEHDGEVVVVSGDYKLAADSTCTPFEPVRCHTFVTESTFGLPVYRWEPPAVLFDRVNSWWRGNGETGRASIVYAYSLGKAQRVLAGINPSLGDIVLHGAVERMTRAYRESGVTLPATTTVSDWPGRKDWAGVLVVAPPSAQGTPWARRFEPASEAVASGWMAVRGVKRRRAVDRGFVVSDHADWAGLNEAVRATGAERVFVTHGSTDTFARWLREQGIDAGVVATQFTGEADEPAEASE